MLQRSIVCASRVACALTCAIVAAYFVNNFNINYVSYNLNNNENSLKLQQFIQTIQCDTVENLPDGWCMDQEMKPRYIDIDNNVSNTTTADASSFELKRYTIKGFEHCLANKTVVFIGESRTRFQYLHLGLSLKTGTFMNCPDRQGYDVECLGIASLATYQSWRGEGDNQNVSTWNDWFKHSTEMLQHPSGSSNNINQSTTPAIGTQTSLCDCYRPEGGFAYNHFFENRYTKRTTVFGEINLIHLLNLKDRVMMNEDYPPYKPFYSTSKRCKPGECGRWAKGDSINAFDGNLNSSLYDIIPKLNDIHIFANPGWDFGTDISCMLNTFANYQPNISVNYMGGPHDISGKCENTYRISRS